MPILEPIKGTAKSVKGIIDYLSKDGRALGADYINCLACDRHGHPVWKQMDIVRHALGCDVPLYGQKTVRTYEQFVISPDPADHIDLKTLRSLSTMWAETYFNDYQVALYYHDDNTHHVLHTHLIVNNANLTEPKRVSADLNYPSMMRMQEGLQRMAAEHGLHAFTKDLRNVSAEEWFLAEADQSQGSRPKNTLRHTRRTAADIDLEARGISWKAETRERITCAIALSRTPDEYREACSALGLSVEVGHGKKTRGEYIYTYIDQPKWRVSGASLGSAWSRFAVMQRLMKDNQNKLSKPTGSSREALIDAIASLADTKAQKSSLRELGTLAGAPVTAKDITSMLETLSELDVRSASDLRESRLEPLDAGARERLARAGRLSGALGFLPEERPSGLPRRRTLAERAGLGLPSAWQRPGPEAAGDPYAYGRTEAPAQDLGLER